MQTLLPPQALVISLLLSACLGLAFPAPGWAGPFAIPLGAAAALLGIALALSGSRRFTAAETNIHSFRDPNVLVVQGPFRWSRNPMYLGLSLVASSVPFALGAWAAWLGPVLYVLWLERVVIPFEESRMEAVFGEAYAGYRRQVRRWFGRRSDGHR